MTMRKWFTMWFSRELEVQGYELPEDATDADRALALRVTREFPRLLPASEAGTDYIEPATLPAVEPVLVECATAQLYSPWFQPGGTP